MTAKLNIGTASSSLGMVTFAGECLQVVTDLRWLIILAILLIAGDFWWGWRECKMHREEAKTKAQKDKYKFHLSLAVRRTLNKLVDYTSYLLLGTVLGLAITEPSGICDHTTAAMAGMIIGCVCEVSSILGHVFYVNGVRVKIDIKRMAIAIIKRKSEDLAEVLDEGIEYIDDGTRKHHAKHPHRMPPVPFDDDESESSCNDEMQEKSLDNLNDNDNDEN